MLYSRMISGGIGRFVAAQTVNDIRGFYSSPAVYKIIPVNLKGKGVPAQDWLSRQLNDPFVKRSR